MSDSLKTVRELIQVTAAYFEGKGVESARLNAERLLGDVLGLSRLDLYLHHDRPLVPAEIDAFRELVRRRAAGEPLQRILGETEFYSRSFKVEPGVFVPRPETERLVETCVGLLTGGPAQPLAPVALEVGCGAGIIAVSLAAEIPRLTVHASDLNPRAVALTGRNARLQGVAARVHAVEAPLCRGFPEALKGKADLLVSNPPYIRSDDIGELPAEVAEHDPREALDGGRDGLEMYRALAGQAGIWLHDEGRLAVEIGADQGDDVAEILSRSGLRDIAVTRDYNDLPRVVTARRGAPEGHGED